MLLLLAHETDRPVCDLSMVPRTAGLITRRSFSPEPNANLSYHQQHNQCWDRSGGTVPHPVYFDPEEGKKGESLTGVAIPRLFSITFAKAGPTKSQR